MAMLGLLAVLGVVAWAVASAGGGASKTDRRTTRVSVAGIATVGAPAPDFDLRLLDGSGRLRLSSLRGRPVLVNFWASWCVPCRREFPLLRRTLRKHAGQDLAIVGVVYQDVASDARSFARDQRASWSLVVDTGRDTADAYGIRAIPQTFFVSRDGRIAQRVFGLSSEAFLEEQLARILPQPSR